ncbi:MAG TPA: hypothetical protein PKG54_06510 [Phycisphaerae bacterium]|jgi:hypothetical protein|nr:hypothetical protein [Phycisphaerae bacterium]HOB74161.1 hypothetical protein [Phycisphaerae bacterium]HOJ55915.1 hypothetical protein [Phycisphaerae bacterium]HOL27619.1 hypothetical protein [Phycisphaerae bacterium]HPP22179.1 hypothetical protein [Phycisphaerae bacterium]
MADKIWPDDRDDSEADVFGEPDGLGGLWEEETDDVEVEFRPVSDEEFSDLTEEEEDPDD